MRVASQTIQAARRSASCLCQGQAARNLGHLCAAAALAGAVWLVYGRALDAPFIFDDTGTILNNPSIRQLWPLWDTGQAGSPLCPPPNLPTSARPLVNLTFAINYHFGQFNTAGYHAFNVTLHILSAWLLWLIVRRTLQLDFFAGRFTRSAGVLSFAAALLWAVHPLNTESVAYTTQRTESLMGCCYLTALWASLNYWQAPAPWRRLVWLAVATAAGVLGMLSKEMMASAIGVVLLYERTFLTGSLRRALANSWPLYLGLALGWIPSVLLLVNGTRTPQAGFHLGVPVYVWWLTQARALAMLLKLAVWPWPLVIHYEIPYLQSLAEAWPWALPVALGIVAAVVLAWRRWAAGFVAVAVLAVLSPTLLIPLPGETLAERRMYVPLAAILPLVCAGSWAGLDRLGRRFTGQPFPGETGPGEPSPGQAHRLALVVFGAAAAALAVVFALVSVRRLAVYEDELALWQDAVKHQPHDPLVQINVGTILAHRGRSREAIPYFEAGLRLNPANSPGHYNLARALAETGQAEAALAHYEAAVRLAPDSFDAQYNFGLALADVGRTSAAIEHFEAALLARPDFAAAHNNLGAALAAAGQTVQALEHFERAVELDPDAEGYANLAFACALAQRPAAAIAAAEKALAMARTQGRAELGRELEAWLNAYRRRAEKP